MFHEALWTLSKSAMDTQTKHNTVNSKANCCHFRIAGTLKITYQSFLKQKFTVTHCYIFRLEVLTAVGLKIQISWDVMLCRCTFYTHIQSKLHCSGYQDTVKSQGTNKPTHWLRRAPKLHKHILEKHPTTLLNYI